MSTWSNSLAIGRTYSECLLMPTCFVKSLDAGSSKRMQKISEAKCVMTRRLSWIK